jgi:hypothetical protein
VVRTRSVGQSRQRRDPAVLTDTTLTERQKSVLVEIYETFHRENQANQTDQSTGSSLTDTPESRSQCLHRQTEKE